MIYITFAKAKKAGACVESYRKLADALGGINAYGKDSPIPLDKVVEICGVADAIWALRCTVEPAELIYSSTKFIIEFACRCAEHCLNNFESVYPDDKRPRQAIEAARGYTVGTVSVEELSAAESAAESAVRSAARSAGSTAWSARSAAESAAWSAARSAESAAIEWQTKTFLAMLQEFGGQDDREKES